MSVFFPGICCSHCFSLGVTAPNAPMTTGTTVVFTSKAFSSSLFKPLYFSGFSCSFFLMLPLLGIGMSQWFFSVPCPPPQCPFGCQLPSYQRCIWRSHRTFAHSISITFGGVSHLDGLPTQTPHRYFCTLCRPPGCGIPFMLFISAYYILLLCVGLLLGPFCIVCTLGLAWFHRFGCLLLWCSGLIPVLPWWVPLCWLLVQPPLSIGKISPC